VPRVRRSFCEEYGRRLAGSPFRVTLSLIE